MTFVNELIPDEDKAKIDWGRFKWSKFSDPHRPWKWTIDRDRDVFLVMLVGLGRDGDHPEMYALWWKGDVIRFKADQDGKEDQAGVDLFWKIFDIEFPTHLMSQRQEIISVLREAVEAHGFVYKREKLRTVTVEIAQSN